VAEAGEVTALDEMLVMEYHSQGLAAEVTITVPVTVVVTHTLTSG
jgi:hypothetical protein